MRVEIRKSGGDTCPTCHSYELVTVPPGQELFVFMQPLSDVQVDLEHELDPKKLPRWRFLRRRAHAHARAKAKHTVKAHRKLAEKRLEQLADQTRLA